MQSTTVTVVFPIGPDACWDLITNIVGYPSLVSSYEAVEVTTDGHQGQGARWTQTRTVFGRSHSQNLEITEWEPPRSVTHEAKEGGTSYRTRYVLTPEQTGDHTAVEVTFTVEATSLFGRTVLTLFGRRLVQSTGAQVERDLAELMEGGDV